MDLHGKQIIAGALEASGSAAIQGCDPATGTRLDPAFFEATQVEIDRALAAAADALKVLKILSPEPRAVFLESIADGIEGLGDALLQRAEAETGLPNARLINERGRTCAQLRMFAGVVREGSWVGASIDHGIADRQPLPKPDLRRMLIPIGPVVVFGASNFPLAYSVAGGDTASAFAAGCPVVVKAHPNHPGTSEMVGEVIRRSVEVSGLPKGTFSLLQGKEIETGAAMVRHPSTKAVGFTGSLTGGRALFDIAASRPEPIPVFAEMGSTNPVFLLPGALADDGADRLAAALHQSVVMGVGQFCTNPGLIVAVRSTATERFLALLTEAIGGTPDGTMLHFGIHRNYDAGVSRVGGVEGVCALVSPEPDEDGGPCQASAGLFATDAVTWLSNPELGDEVFGPSTLLVECRDEDEMQLVAENLHGQLTASIHGDPSELAAHEDLLRTLEDVAGRVIMNGIPTGVEVCPSMQHGGPYPATTDARSTSVGSFAIQRFARPVAYQDMPGELLPAALADANPLGLLRVVDGNWTREATT